MKNDAKKKGNEMVYKSEDSFVSILRVAECESKYFPKTSKKKIREEIKKGQSADVVERGKHSSGSLNSSFLD